MQFCFCEGRPVCREEVLSTPVWRVLLWRVNLFCAYVDPVCTFPSAKASLAHVSPWCVYMFAYFSFERGIVCVISLLIVSSLFCVFFLSAKKYCLRQFGAYYFGAYIFFAPMLIRYALFLLRRPVWRTFLYDAYICLRIFPLSVVLSASYLYFKIVSIVGDY